MLLEANTKPADSGYVSKTSFTEEGCPSQVVRGGALQAEGTTRAEKDRAIQGKNDQGNQAATQVGTC